MEQSPIQGVNQQVTQTDMAYLAGIWDGEGSIGINKYKNPRFNGTPKNAVHLTMSNTDVAIINEVTRIMDIMKINGHIALRERGFTPCYQIDIRRLDSCKILLENIIQYLKGKKELAILVLRYIDKRIASCKNKPDLNFQRDGKCASMKRADCYTEDEQKLVDQIRAINSSRCWKRGTSTTNTQSQPLVA